MIKIVLKDNRTNYYIFQNLNIIRKTEYLNTDFYPHSLNIHLNYITNEKIEFYLIKSISVDFSIFYNAQASTKFCFQPGRYTSYGDLNKLNDKDKMSITLKKETVVFNIIYRDIRLNTFIKEFYRHKNNLL